jgi:hypothetical protein
MLPNTTQIGNSQRTTRTRTERIARGSVVVVAVLLAQASLIAYSGVISQNFMNQSNEITQTLLERWSLSWFGDVYVGINIMKTVAAGLIGCDALYAAFWLTIRLRRRSQPRAFPIATQLAF